MLGNRAVIQAQFQCIELVYPNVYSIYELLEHLESCRTRYHCWIGSVLDPLASHNMKLLLLHPTLLALMVNGELRTGVVRIGYRHKVKPYEPNIGCHGGQRIATAWTMLPDILPRFVWLSESETGMREYVIAKYS